MRGLKRGHYQGLDLIRLAAASLVVMYHLTFWWWLPAREPAQAIGFRDSLLPLGHIFSGGWVGVQIFFVLSGFFIAFSANGKAAIPFLISRARRLYPAVWICATLTLPIVYGAGAGGNYLRTMVLSPFGPWLSGVYWTLAIEVVFYLLVALVLAIWGASSLTRLGVFLGCYGSIFWWLHIVNLVTGYHLQPFFFAIENLHGYLLLLHHGCYFGLGILLWRGVALGWQPWVIGLVIVFAISGALGVVGVSHGIAPLLAVGSDVPDYRVAPLIWCAALALIVASIVWNERFSNIVGRHQRKIRFLGLLTYPLYLVHEDLGHSVMTAFGDGHPRLALVMGIVCVLGVSYLVTVAESAIQSAFSRWTGKSLTPTVQLP